MHKIVERLFLEEKIEYFSALDYSGLKAYNTDLLERMDFTPRTAVVFLVPYFVERPVNISAYASSLDYHLYVGELTERLSQRLADNFPGYKFKGFVDHSPIDERYAALVGGLGLLGDSGMLINEKYGTYTFIADIVSDIPPSLLGQDAAGVIRECMHCGRCKSFCPTGILTGCGKDCLSAITQRKGELEPTEVEMMRKFDTVWGCDVCQQVCPYNEHAARTPIDFFYKNRIQKLTTDYLDTLNRDELRKHAFGWRGRAVIKRNLEKLGY